MNGIRGRSPNVARWISTAAALLLALSATACFAGDDDGTSPVAVKLRGCTVTEGGPPRTAPGGYYTNGTTVCTAGGKPHLFHGVDRPSLEWSPAGDNISAADFQAMAGWHANVVRIATNQDFWLAGAALHDPTYPGTIAQAVKWAEAAGLDVILDLHWSDQGNLGVKVAGGSSTQNSPGGSNQQQMADVNSKEFWQEVATTFKGDGRVLFELYNEPNDISWDLWLNGGPGPGFQVVGMQELYDTVRATGADNVVIAGGLDWASDLSGVTDYPVQGYNIMYASHQYLQNGDSENLWSGVFGYLAAGDIAPVILTEFGDGTSMCAGAYDTSLIEFANVYDVSWTAWAWFPAGCSFPALISYWAPGSGGETVTATSQGQAVHGALLAYPWSPPAVTDSGAGGSDATLDGAPGDATLDGTSHADETSTGDAPAEAALSSDAGTDEAGDTADGAATDGA